MLIPPDYEVQHCCVESSWGNAVSTGEPQFIMDIKSNLLQSVPVSLAVVTTVGFMIQFWKLKSVSIKVLEGHVKILQGINSYLWVLRPQEVSDLSVDAKLGDLGSEVQFWKASQNFEAAHNFFNCFGQQFLGIFPAAHRAAQNLDALTQ